MRRWGIVAATSLLLVLLFSGLSNALYGGGGQEQAASLERRQQPESSPPEETTTATEPTTDEAGGAAGGANADKEEDRDRGRYDAVATVTEVVDGDTIEISPAIEGNDEVRLIGVDTPETKDPDEEVEPYGPEASNYAETELDGEEVELEFDAESTDQYGRLLAYVYPMGEEMFNEDLLKGGYAQVYNVPPNDRYEGQLRAAQEEARDADLGIWGLSREEQCKLANRGNGIGEGTPRCGKASAPKLAPAPAPSGGADIDCADFSSRLEAQAVLEADPSDPNGLDADGDGEACEDSSSGGGDIGGGGDFSGPQSSASAPATSSAAPSGGGGGVPPISEDSCPAGYPIKGNGDSGIYHVPGGAYYDVTNPEECFATAADARAAGYRASEL